jgi:MFS transporter, FHS family, L-fucose permease
MKIVSTNRGSIHMIESGRNWNLCDLGVGKYRSQGSSVLIMAILGAAVVPLFQGLIPDLSGIHMSFIVPLFCYIYVLYYGFYGYKIKHKINELNKTC